MAGLFCCACCAEPEIPKLRLHVDADRNGEVDRSTNNLDRWQWGKNPKIGKKKKTMMLILKQI